MRPRAWPFVWLASALAVLAVGSSPATAATANTVTAGAPAVAPLTGGDGAIVLRATTFDLASVGYEVSEWSVSGTASAYSSARPLTRDGRWSVQPATTAPFTTRIVVERPVHPERFSGTVVVEWLNVSAGIDHAPTFVLTHTALLRRGDVWIGVSAQRAGLEGFGVTVGGQAATKVEDPARYGALHIPSDSYSYDIFTQVAAAVRASGPNGVLGGLTASHVLAVGQSQSAFRLTTYADAVQPRTHAFDGFFLHSRGAAGAPLSESPQANLAPPSPTYVRDDLDVPVMVFTSESDLFELGAVDARRSDTDRYREWEVAGTSHFDGYGFSIGRTDDGDGTADVALFDAMVHPSSALTGDFTSCAKPVNAGPHHYVAAAALVALERWVEAGVAPTHAPRLRSAHRTIVRDADGNARGGIRTPEVDAPVATLSGSASGAGCGIYGTTTAFTADQLARRYPTHDAFVRTWDASVARAAHAGFLLPDDAAHLRAAAEHSTIGRS